MAKILGLDLGTNSIGWAVTETTDGKTALKEKGVHIFSEGVKSVNGNELSRAAERTGFRSARKLKFRRKLRKYKTLKALIEALPLRMCPLSIDELEQWKSSVNSENGKKQSFVKYPQNEEFLNWLKTDEETGKNPYAYRDKFSRQRYDWENNQSIAFELGRVFYHLAQRRGFASNKIDGNDEDKIENVKQQWQNILNSIDEDLKVDDLIENIELHILENFKEESDEKVKSVVRSINKLIDKTTTKETNSIIDEINKILSEKKNLGKVKLGIETLNERMKGFETLGQYFYHLYQENRHNTENKIRNNYTDREEHYIDEFEKICSKQQLPENLVTELKKAIFFQRPLKSQKGLVGKCSFEKTKPRCPVSHPAFEEYRMWSFINTIEIKNGKESRKLNPEEKDKILEKFYRKSAHFDFKEIAKILQPNYPIKKDAKGKPDKKTEPDPERKYFNYKGNTTVAGCPVTGQLMNIFGRNWEDRKKWKELLTESWKTKTFKNGEIKSTNSVVNEFWLALFNAYLLGDKKEIIGKTISDKLKDFAKENTTLTDEQIKRFSGINGLRKEYANLSINAINKINPYLRQGLIYSHAVFMANMEKVVDENIWSAEKNREAIKKGIDNILEEHEFENTIVSIINGQLKENREKKYTYSEEAETLYKKNIESRLKLAFGEKTWAEQEDTGKILQSVYEKFIAQFKRNEGKGEFLKNERIDDKVISFLRGENSDGEIYCSDEKRLKKLYHPSDIERFRPIKLKEKGEEILRNDKPLLGLGSPVIPSIKNPMAMRTLHQLRKLMNHLIKEDVIDYNTRIHIELARELNDANKRAAIERYQNERKAQREIYRQKIKELYHKETGKNILPNDEDVLKFSFWMEQDKDHSPPIIISEKDVEKYQYWDEQFHRCIYTGKTIRISDFIGQNPTFDIEHTIPRSSLDNSQMNKTLCYNKYNRDIKSDSLPTACVNYEKPQTITFKDGEKCDCPAISIGIIEKWKERYLELDDRIKFLVKRAKGSSTKEQKDKIIQERHYLTFHRDYWKGKYERFTLEEIKEGFVNRQKADTGIITKYSREFLSSLFKNKNGNSNVYAVNGQMTDAFRKAWGLHEKEVDENGNLILNNHGLPVLKEKDRSNHVHHCIDAVTIACMTKDKYDTMAHAWTLEDKGKLKEARKEMENSKPWSSFTTDMEKLKNEVLVLHISKDNAAKQSVRKLRKRGKIVYTYKEQLPERMRNKTEGKHYFKIEKDGKTLYKVPKYSEGDTVRGALHQDTFYGAIEKDKEGNINTDKEGKLIPNYVLRKEISKLSEGDIENIVDKDVREILKKAIEDKIITFKIVQKKKVAVVKPDETIWRNKEKGIPIKKVRFYAYAKELIDIKEQRDKKTDYPHKWHYHAQKKENYCMAIYEGKNNKGKIIRECELINLYEAGEYYKSSNINHKKQYPIAPENKNGLGLKVIIKKGQLVLLYINNREEIWELSDMEKMERLYEITGIDTEDSCIKLLYHQEARDAGEVTKHMGLKSGKKGGKLIGKHKEFPWIKVTPNDFDALVEGIDFKITPTGKIQKK